MLFLASRRCGDLSGHPHPNNQLGRKRIWSKCPQVHELVLSLKRKFLVAWKFNEISGRFDCLITLLTWHLTFYSILQRFFRLSLMVLPTLYWTFCSFLQMILLYLCNLTIVTTCSKKIIAWNSVCLVETAEHATLAMTSLAKTTYWSDNKLN